MTDNWAIGNNRLAIQGLDGGIQPFYNFSKKICAVYNGEIYNHLELKNFLKNKGYIIDDKCDGSVIVPLYELYGEEFVKYLDSMFAIAIMDIRTKEKLILANDQAAIKSVYYYHDKTCNNFYFASEIKALLEFPFNCKLRSEAVNEYLIGGSIWHNNTFFEDIKTLAPSSVLIKEIGKEVTIKSYLSNISAKLDRNASFEEISNYFHSMLDDEIAQMVKSEVPICVVTSGGLDSSYITALSAKYISNLNTFNVAYERKWAFDEKHYAKEVSDYYGAKYNQVIITESEFPDILKKTVESLGQPNSAPHSLSTYALFKAIKQSGFKVALTGEGADEFFGRYDRFKNAVLNSSTNWLDDYFDVMGATKKTIRESSYSKAYQNLLLSNKFDILENSKKNILINEKNTIAD